MAELFDRSLFEHVFSDAQVVDVDFSRWDKLISICVVADHLPRDADNRLALMVVDFLRVSKFSLAFSHLDVALEEPDLRFRWHIYDFTLTSGNNRITLSLFGHKTSPMCDIECAGIDFRRIPLSLLDDIFPGWASPNNDSLARPGIEAIGRLYNRQQNGGD